MLCALIIHSFRSIHYFNSTIMYCIVCICIYLNINHLQIQLIELKGFSLFRKYYKHEFIWNVMWCTSTYILYCITVVYQTKNTVNVYYKLPIKYSIHHYSISYSWSSSVQYCQSNFKTLSSFHLTLIVIIASFFLFSFL